MKKLLSALIVIAALGFMAMPASADSVGRLGYIYEDSTTPGSGYNNVGFSKTGAVTCSSYFSIVGLGDCSVKAAMKAGKISSLSFYDISTKSILGFRKIKVTAYGN